MWPRGRDARSAFTLVVLCAMKLLDPIDPNRFEGRALFRLLLPEPLPSVVDGGS